MASVMTAPAVRMRLCHGCGQVRVCFSYGTEPRRNYCFACVRELVDKALGIRKSS